MTSSIKRLVKSSPFLAALAVPAFRARSVVLSHLPVRGAIPTFTGRARLAATTFGSIDEYQSWKSAHENDLAAATDADTSAEVPGHFAFDTDGYCAICDVATSFVTTMEYVSGDTEGPARPNWREHLICRSCGLRNRVRAALQIAIQDLGMRAHHNIYITEQFGPVYRWLKGRFGQVTGSEYIKPNRPSGTQHWGINHQDVQSLSFADGKFDYLMSFDVLEHVPDNAAAFAEMARVLRPGGRLVLTIPFTANQFQTTERAKMNADGAITHYLPVEVHGNPTDPINGSLCFRHYGWESLDQLKQAGFCDTLVHGYHSRDLGYLGADQVLISAIRA